MNTYEKAIKESLDNIQAEPSEALRNRVMLSVAGGVVSSRDYRRRLPVRAAVLAAIIAVLILTTAATFGNEIVGAIRQLMFGDSIATQVIRDSELYDDLGGWGVMNREELSNATDYPLGLFETLEEARQAAPFPIKELSYLPNSVTGLRNVGVWRVEDPDNPWLHFVVLSYDIALRGGGISILQLRQAYAGQNAYIVIEHVSPAIEKVMVGDSEAVLISAPEKFILGDGTVVINEDMIRYALHWLKDGIAYELSVDHHDGFTPETMIRIAESVR